MKKSILSIVFIFCLSLSLMAQETVEYRITYQSIIVPRRDQTDKYDLLWNLDIGHTTSVFYSTDMRCMNAEIDSIRRGRTDMAVVGLVMRAMSKYPYTNHLEVLRGVPEKKKCLIQNNIGKTYRYEEEVPRITWQLAEDTCEIASYPCKKAVAKVLGRTWEVWYTEEIPLDNGPWLLGGLPGLILQAEDTDHFFYFTCVNIKQVADDSRVVLSDIEYIPCQKKEYIKLRTERDEDPLASAKNQLGLSGITIIRDKSGKQVERLNSVPRNHLDRY